jgi:hypothetical protein
VSKTVSNEDPFVGSAGAPGRACIEPCNWRFGCEPEVTVIRASVRTSPVRHATGLR